MRLDQSRNVLKIPNCLQYGFFNGGLRCPPKSPYTAAVEKNEWIVAYPSPIASTIFQFRSEIEFVAGPLDRIIYLTVFISAQIEGVHACGALLDAGQDRVDTILDAQV
jgi:hypothetical protein